MVTRYIDNNPEPVHIDVPSKFTKSEFLTDTWIENVYLPYHDSGLAAAEEDPDHPLSALPDWAATGAYNFAKSANVMQVQLGLDNPEHAAKEIREYEEYLSQVKYSKEVITALTGLAEADSVKEFWDVATTGPGLEAIAKVAGSSLVQYAPVLVTVLGAGLAGAGFVALGAISGMGSFIIEYGASAVDAMNDYLKTQDTDISDDKAVADLLSNEDKMAEFSVHAVKRGIPIGIIDGLSVGFAGKFSNYLRKAMQNAEKASKTTKKLAYPAALATEALVIQPGLGGLGEAAAQKAAGEEFQLGQVALEIVAEVPGGTVETGLGVMMRNRKMAKEERLKEKAKQLAKDKTRKNKEEELIVVNKDLTGGRVNPRTGLPESGRYLDRLLNYSGQAVVEGEFATDKIAVKKSLFPFITNPASADAIIDYFEKEGVIRRRRGTKSYEWTAEAEEVYNKAEEARAARPYTEKLIGVAAEEEVEPVAGEIPLEEVVAEKVDVIKEQPVAGAIPTPEAAATPATAEAVVTPEAAATAEAAGVTPEAIATVEEPPLEGAEEIKTVYDFTPDAVPLIGVEGSTLDTPAPTDTYVPSARRLLGMDEGTIPDRGDPTTIATGTGTGEQTSRTPAVSQAYLDMIKNNMPVSKRKKFESFELTPTSPEDVHPQSIQANQDEIAVAQDASMEVDPANPGIELNEKIQASAYLSTLDIIKKILNMDITATSQQQLDQYQKLAEQKIKEYNSVDMASGVWANAWKVFHPMRLAEKYPMFRSFYTLVLARRESREQMNHHHFAMVEDFLTNTSIESAKQIGKVSVILDALATRIRPVIHEKDIKVTKEGGLEFVIPEELPTILVKDTETGEEIPQSVMDEKLYDTTLKQWGVAYGEKLSLTPEEYKKFKDTQAAFKSMFDRITLAFTRKYTQKYPLYPGMAFSLEETVDSTKENLVGSVEKYINDIIGELPKDKAATITTKNLRKRISNIREDYQKVFDQLEKVKNENVNEFFKAKVETVLAQLNAIKIINRHLKMLKDHPYYIPRLRYGDYYITVEDTETGKFVHSETSSPFAFDSALEVMTFQKDSLQKQRLEKRRKELENIYSEKTPTGKLRYKVSKKVKERKTESIARQLQREDVSLIEALANTLGYGLVNPVKSGEVTEVVQEFIKEMDKAITTKGFDVFLKQRSPEQINGYYTDTNAPNYLAQSLSSYIRTGADTASNLEYYNPVMATLTDLDPSTKRKGTGREDIGNARLFKVAKRVLEDINNPNEPGSVYKSAAFFYALGFNFSSATVNLSQSYVATVPVLNSIIGFKGGSAAKEVTVGIKDAVRLFKLKNNLSSYGFRFEEKTLPKAYESFLTQDEWTMLRNLHTRGVIQAIVNIDLGAKYKQAVGEVSRFANPKIGDAFARVMDASAFAFGAAEQVNRIAAALAAYRLAQRPGNLAKFRKFGQTTTFSDVEMTPQEAARMTVYKTQFLVSKENRPQLFRNGFMNVATQFMSFPLQYMGIYAHALNVAKVDPRTAGMLLGGLVLSMMFFGGMMGLPFTDNLRQLIASSTRAIKDEYEFDIEAGMREVMTDTGFNPTLIDVMMRGAASHIFRADVSKRMGVGEIYPYDLFAGNLMVATGPFGGLLVDSVKRAYEGYTTDNYTMMMSSALPLGMRYVVEGGMSIFDESIPVRTTQGRALMPSTKLTTTDKLIRTLGFTPKTVADERRKVAYSRYAERRPRSLQDMYLTELARAGVGAKKALEQKEMEDYREYRAEMERISKEVQEINKEKMEQKKFKDLIRITARSLRERMIIEYFGQSSPQAMRRSMSKRLRRELTPERLRALGFGG